ncbi:MAG: hypothetical protein N2508_14605 [Anaerolineae bacterium]|nr:hypothetical protein [Anaerolineae bacterium]
MVYAAELFYFQDQQDFPFQRAVLVTAKTIARWCTHFQARLIAPGKKQAAGEKQGRLPDAPAEREAFVTELVQWLFAHSVVEELFCLLLDDEPVPRAGKVAKFDHHDDTCCWLLNLSESEFADLQNAWRENDLPSDLFYPVQEMICIPYPGHGLKPRVLRLLGVRKCYTPAQWRTRGLHAASSTLESGGARA